MVTVDLTLVAGETDRTHTLVCVHQVPTFAAVLARLGRAFIDVDVAVFTGVAGGAAAVVVVHQVDAKRAVLTLTDAVVDVLRAILPRETAPASAAANIDIIRLRSVESCRGKSFDQAR